MTLAAFFVAAGAYLGYRVEQIGTFPKSRHIVHFSYEKGRATFDGLVWEYHID